MDFHRQIRSTFSRESWTFAKADSPSFPVELSDVFPPKTRKKLKPNPMNSVEYQKRRNKKLMSAVLVRKIANLGKRPSNSSSSTHAKRMAKAENGFQEAASFLLISTKVVLISVAKLLKS